MIPGFYNITVYQGSFYGPLRLTLPSLASFDGPEDLDDPSVSLVAQIRPKANSDRLLASFDIEVIGGLTRQVELTLPSARTATLTESAAWDLVVARGDENWPILAGKVTVMRGVSRW